VNSAGQHATDRRQWHRVATECACMNLRKTARAVTQAFDRILAPSRLRATQFTVLVAAALADPPTMTRIAGALIMDPSTLTRNLRPLERAGLIKIVGGKDRRSRLVTLTQRGRDRLTTTLPLWERAQTQVVRGIGGSRWHDILEDLATVRTLADTA
jgi:DNA-binding MarR family transcriptional regulator